MLVFLILFANFHIDVIAYLHKKPLELKLWNERCKKKSVVLNDCNWCWCDSNQRYQCAARVCTEIDMFGHFKDAIQEIDVGMEGHGVWRSTDSPCAPGVHYRRGGVLCVCNEDGDWPNPVCRDLFRVLYSVEITNKKQVTGEESCLPTKLYLVGCNVCFCPHTGKLNPDLCTERECRTDDPVLEEVSQETDVDKHNPEEIYATCDTNNHYLLGCRRCVCLRNNRLLCDDCVNRVNKMLLKSDCQDKEPGQIFNIDCNFCYCDENSNTYCTVRNCLQLDDIKQMINPKEAFKAIQGRRETCRAERLNCNTCECITNEKGEYLQDCTIELCPKTKPTLHDDCVVNTIYELNCMICNCRLISDKKHEICRLNPVCTNDTALKEQRPQDTQQLHGYCEPLHLYEKDCNQCQCLADGQTLKCSSKVCADPSDSSEYKTSDVSIDVVPVKLTGDEKCPNGRSYKLDCNICFCLSNGNALCTTVDCSKKE